MAGGFDDLEMKDFDINIDSLENYSDSQLNDYFNEISLEKESLYKRHGDNDNTPEFVRVKYGKYNIELKVIEEERDRREESKSVKDSRNYSRTSWIDEFINYKKTDLGVLKTHGTRKNLDAFVNTFIGKDSKVNKKVKGDNRDISVMFIRSFLSISDGNGVRPLLNNRESFELLKDTTFSREGSVGKGGILSILKYKGVDVREINVNKKDTMRRLNENTEEEREFTKLVNGIFSLNTNTVERISKELGVPQNAVQKTISDDNSSGVQISSGLTKEIKERYINGESIEKISKEVEVQLYLVNEIVKEITRDETIDYFKNKKTYYTQPTDKIVKEMVLENYKNDKQQKPDSNLSALKKQLEDPELFDLTGPADDGASTSFLLPEVVTNGIIDNSVSEIRGSLHSHAREIESLVLTEQELREFAGILSPKGSTDTKIEALEATADEYRLKALNEADPAKEQLYKSIQKTAELKADFISIVEKGEPPKNSEAISIFREQVESNESANDISRFERFKRWIKENWLGASSLIITIASMLTTVIVLARGTINKGAKAAGSFADSVYKTFKNIAKKLGPIFSPVVLAIGSLLFLFLKYGAKGIAWLANNLWIIVIAILFFIYYRYRGRGK